MTPSPLMRAAVVTGPRRAEVVEVPLPVPREGQVRIRVEGCGVCASNLTPWEGSEWMRFPTDAGSLGHEGWGRVDAVGPDVTRVKEGDRVAALSYNSYAEYDLAGADAVVPLPPEFDAMPFPAEPIGCAMNIFRRSDIRPGQTVAIVGVGFLGCILTRLAANAGARVIAVARRPFARDLARLYGAEEVIALGERQEVVKQVEELTDGRLCDRVIEAVGKQAPLDLAAELAAERARLVIAGYHQDGPRQVNMWLWNWRGLDVVNAHERDPGAYRRGMEEGIEAVRSGAFDLMPLVTHSYPLDGLGDALDATRDRPEGFMKAVICP